MAKKKISKQDELDKTFLALKKKIKPYQKKMKVLLDKPHRYELCSTADYEVTSERTGKTTKKKDPYFVGLILQRTYVGFYFMAPYIEKGFMDDFSEAMQKRLKGKSCFYFKSTEEVGPEVDRLLKKGYAVFKKRGLL
ncbi:hypothetical protein [Bdellovibrio sp. HCB337]|uniref:hypothetical protein n=1 Tax=Bdellovibrio sp. HCB337 TaxID=3394358 RepID=UPI0039A403B9